MLLNQRKHKLLSKLVALTFAFNAISPVAFAAEETTVNDTTTATTATTTKSGQLSLASVQADILNRIAQTEVKTFQSKKLNISEEELNNLMNVPLSTTTDETSYLTQEEKDYNNLQLLIAQGLNTKEKRAEALNKLEAIDELSKTDESVGGLTNTEKYVKTLLENYEDIESRVGSSGALSSAITPTDSSIIAYKTILKVASAERLACRNDATANKTKADKGEKLAEGTNTDPDSCKLSERGQEAAQILTYLTNQQVNQTTDTKKTTNATNAVTTATGERTCADKTNKPAANNMYKCCPTDKPYINTSTGKCDTKTQNDSKDDDDDDITQSSMATLLAGALARTGSTTLQQTQNTGTKKTEETAKETVSKSSNEANLLKKLNRQNKITSKSAKGTYTPEFAKRVGKVTLEFNEKSGAEKLSDGKLAYVHIGESNTEFQVKVKLSGSENAVSAKDKDGKEQKPIKINVYSYNFLSKDKDTVSNQVFTSQKNKNPNEFITVVFAENKTYNGLYYKKVPREQPYPLYIEITDGTSRIFYTVYYKIYDMKSMITEQVKQNTANEIEILPNEDEDYGLTHGTIQGKLKGATWENGKCNLQVSGKYADGDNQSMNFDSSVGYEQMSQSDCDKLNDKAKTGNLEITLQHASVSLNASGEGLAFDADNVTNPAIKDVETGKFMTEEQFRSEFKSVSNLKDNNVSIPFGKTANGYQVNYDVGTGKFMQFTENGWVEMTNKEISEGFLNGKEVSSSAKITFSLNKESGLPALSVDGNTYDVDMNQLNGKTVRSKDIIDGKVGLHSLTDEVASSITTSFKEVTPYNTIYEIVNSDDSLGTVKNKLRNSAEKTNESLKKVVKIGEKSENDNKKNNKKATALEKAKATITPVSKDSKNDGDKSTMEIYSQLKERGAYTFSIPKTAIEAQPIENEKTGEIMFLNKRDFPEMGLGEAIQVSDAEFKKLQTEQIINYISEHKDEPKSEETSDTNNTSVETPATNVPVTDTTHEVRTPESIMNNPQEAPGSPQNKNSAASKGAKIISDLKDDKTYTSERGLYVYNGFHTINTEIIMVTGIGYAPKNTNNKNLARTAANNSANNYLNRLPKGSYYNKEIVKDDWNEKTQTYTLTYRYTHAFY